MGAAVGHAGGEAVRGLSGLLMGLGVWATAVYWLGQDRDDFLVASFIGLYLGVWAGSMARERC